MNCWKKYISSISIFLVLACNSYCQKTIFPNYDPPESRFRAFKVLNGLSGMDVKSLLVDNKGFLWCGIETGLYMFDGKKYNGYKIGETDSTIYGTGILCIFEDSKNKIWAGSTGALNRIDQRSGRVKHFIPDTSFYASLDNKICQINEDRKGNLWLITAGNIYTFDRTSEKFTRYPVDSLAWHDEFETGISGRKIFLEDKDGRIWIATNNGLYCYSGRDWKKVYPSDNGKFKIRRTRVNCIESDNTGKIWCGTEDNGLVLIDDPDKSAWEEIEPGTRDGGRQSSVTAINRDNSGFLWIFSNNCLYRFDPVIKKSSIWYIFSDNELPGKKWGKNLVIDKIFQGKRNSIWLFDYQNGYLFHFEPENENLSLFPVPDSLAFTAIQDTGGNFWIGSIYSNIFRLLSDSLPYFEKGSLIHSPKPDLIHWSRIEVDGQGQIWLALTGGLYRIIKVDYKTGMRTERFNLPDKNSNASSVFQDSDGNYWFGCINGIIFNYSPVKRIFRKYYISSPGEQNNKTITRIRQDRSGNLWFATYSDGLYVIRPGSGKAEKYLEYSDLSGKKNNLNILDILTDSFNNIWLSTTYGLYRIGIEDKKITDFTGFDRTGKTTDSWYIRIIEDDNRNLWILNSIKGPYIFNKESETFRKVAVKNENYGGYYRDMISDRNSRIWIVQNDNIKILDQGSGLIRNLTLDDLSVNIISHKAKSGEIMILNGDRLEMFPANIPYNRIVPPVYITGLYINDIPYNRVFQDNVKVTDLKKVELNYSQNTLRIEFSALNYIQPELNRYRYFMSGMDKDTVEIISDPVTTYKNMSPGRYRFWVTGSNNDGFWNKEGITLEIRIHPPFYKSVLAMILYCFVIISVLTILIRNKISRLRLEKQKLEDQVKERTAEIESKNRQLEDIDSARTRFFTNISHEIRTPLSLILGPLEELIKEKEISGESTGLLETMQRNGHRLMQLVTELLDFSRLDAGKMKIILSEGDIIKWVRMFVYDFVSLAEKRHISFIVEIAEKECSTYFDREKTEKIISNLLSNAFKFTPESGIVKCSIDIQKNKTRPYDNDLLIVISDTGPGIKDEHLARIFDRFYRIEDTGKTEGAGLGLAITYEFAALLHGEITVKSQPDSGSEFTVVLPLGKNHLAEGEYLLTGSDITDKTKTQHQDLNKKNTGAGFHPYNEDRMKILIIEDNEDLRNYLSVKLAEEYEVLQAENGTDGLNLALTMIPDLVITDIMMPGIDGISLCTQLKNNERTSHIPVVMLTSKATTGDKLNGLKSGADDYIVKPFEMAELIVRIQNLILQREKLRERFRNYRYFSTSREKSSSIDEKFMSKIYSIIDENLGDYNFDAGTLHELSGMSRVHLFRKIKAITGLPPSILIRNMRMEKGAQLLKIKAGNITEIANTVGISNPSYFTKCFKNYFGVSPKKFTGSDK